MLAAKGLRHTVTACVLAIWAVMAQALADVPKTLKGVALIIGEAKYAHLPALTNPIRDAKAIGGLFTDLGFNVTATSDRDAKKLRRDLANFAADAEGADVAVVYYSGHGIEAGGENWLVPVDVDASALATAEQSLVPLSGLLNDLKASVPLTLVFLDACRTNPFPPGALLKRGDAALPVSAGGLSLAKGMAEASTESAQQGAGSVIAFAAEPGHVALDGPADGNSPYAAALLRHLSASTGTEFGTVMRLVTEEVYLKTGGQQRPWFNETLTKLLYFGAPHDDLGGEAGQILHERRQVLLTIDSLDAATRVQVETEAQRAGVPMDALYGLLNALGAEIPTDPVRLEGVLKTQTAQIKKKIAAIEVLGKQDAEVVRLSKLADEALANGAVQANLLFMQQADERQHVVDASLDKSEADLRARRLGSAETKAKLAGAYALTFRFDEAAQGYEEAYLQVEKWEPDAALYYGAWAAQAWWQHGRDNGNNPALLRSIALDEKLLQQIPRDRSPLVWGELQVDLGNTLQTLGERENGNEHLKQAERAYRSALTAISRAWFPADWAQVQNDLGSVLQALGEREAGVSYMENAAEAYHLALEEMPEDSMPFEWANVQNNLGVTLTRLGERESGTGKLDLALAAFRAALRERQRDKTPQEWAVSQTNIGYVLYVSAIRSGDSGQMAQAVNAFRSSLQELPRERLPLDWALTQNNLGLALMAQGASSSNTKQLDEAITAFGVALEERRKERVPLDWARTQNNLGLALQYYGGITGDEMRLEQSATAFRSALEVFSAETVPLDWATIQSNLGLTLYRLGQSREGSHLLEAAISAYRQALLVQTAVSAPTDFADTQDRLGIALDALAQRLDGAAKVRTWLAAVDAWRSALVVYGRQSDPASWAKHQNTIGYTLVLVGEVEESEARFKEAEQILREALSVQQGLGADEAAFTADSLCHALIDLGVPQGNRAMLREAKELCESAVAGERRLGEDDAVKETQANLEKLNAVLMAP